MLRLGARLEQLQVSRNARFRAESKKKKKTPGEETWRQTPKRWCTPGKSWRKLPRTADTGEKLSMAYAPRGGKRLKEECKIL